MKNSKIRTSYFIFIGLFILSSIGFYPGDPPAGRTGAPGDGLCTDCHGTGNPLGIDGGIDIINFPSNITPGQTYLLTALASNPNGIAVRAGFQAVVLTDNNQNAGDLFSTTSNPATQTSGGREYIEHRPAKIFPASNQVSWNFMWTAPMNTNQGDGITIYASSIIASGTNGEDSDFMVLTQANGIMDAAMDPLTVSITSTTDADCFGSATGTATALAAGGNGGYTYNWSNGQSGPMASGFFAGTHSVTVVDGNNDMATETFSIGQPSAVTLGIVSQTNLDCDNALGSATVEAFGGTPGYTYQWSNGGSGPTQSNLLTGGYVVTATDANLCIGFININITADFTVPIADAGPDKVLACDVASVTLDGSGSTVGLNIDYQWLDENGVEISNNITVNVNQAGIYTLFVTDLENGCTSSDQVEVTNAPNLFISLAGTDPSCPGATDGSIDLTITDGTSPFNFDWDLNSLDGIEDPTGLIAGLYSVTVTDDNGCEAMGSITLVYPLPIDLNATWNDITCHGSCDGSIDINLSGGGGPFDYSWTPTLPSVPDQSNLCPGEYSVTVTNGNNCTAMATFVLTEPTEIIVTRTSTDVTCNGSCDGTITLAVTGGTGIYTYDWGTSTTPVLNGLCAGTYVVTVTDSNGCTKTHTATIVEPQAILLDISVVKAISCNGVCDGELLATVSGGVGGYNFDWNLLPDVHNPVNVCAGMYSLVVADANGCEVSATINLTEPDLLEVAAITNNISCSSAGSIGLSVTGGTPDYMYDWDENDFDGQNNPTITTPGVYNVTVSDASGCFEVLQFIMDAPAEINVSLSATGETSSNANDGTATAVPTGGTGNISFLWSNNESTNTIDNLEPGNYSVTVTDENNCTATGAVTVNSFDCNLAVTLDDSNVTCNGENNGSITASASNGTSPYTYEWSNEETGATISSLAPGSYTVTATDASNCEAVASTTINEPGLLQATANVTHVSCDGQCNGNIDLEIIGGTSPYSIGPTDLTDLCAGNYEITITDANNCLFDLIATVSAPAPMFVDVTSTDVTSIGGEDGTATAVPDGGVTPYTYQWNDAPASTTSTITGLVPGTYCVTVADGNGCEVEGCTTVNDVNCNMVGNLNLNPTTCHGEQDGSAMVIVTGGTGLLTYQWSSSNSTDNTANDLPAGNQSVTIIDAANCELVLDFFIDQPDPLTLTIAHENESSAGANDGVAMAMAEGGVGVLSFLWSNGEQSTNIIGVAPGEYCVTVTDENLCMIEDCVNILSGGCALEVSISIENVSCNGNADGTVTANTTGAMGAVTFNWSSSNNTNNVETNLSAGTYTLTVEDGIGCEAILPFTVTEPSALELSFEKTDETAAGAADGSATALVVGGTGSYSFLWSTGEETQTIVNLTEAEYCVTVIDENNCEVSGCVNILSGGCALVATINVNQVSCYGGIDGEAIVATDGAVGMVNYSWSTSANSTNAETGISVGSHMVTITDAAGCVVILPFTITEPDALTLSLTVTPESVANANDGGVAAMVSGGTPGYTYNWNVANAGQPTITDLSPGEYCVTVTDANNCSISSCATVNPAGCELAIEMATATMSCAMPCDGSIAVTVSGGVGDLIYDWSDVSIGNTANPTGLCPGAYTVSVTDDEGCVAQASVTIEEHPFSLIADLINNDCGDCNASISLSANGTAPYDFDWENNDYDGQSTLTDLCNGTYTCTVTDANGCQEVFCTSFATPEELTATAETVSSCFGDCTGSAMITILGGTPPYQLTGDGIDPNDLCPGNYETTITDANDCEVLLEWSIDEFEEITVVVDEIGPDIDGQNTGYINVTVEGIGPFSYNWIQGTDIISSDEDPQNLAADQYILIVFDANDCVMASEFVTVPMTTNTIGDLAEAAIQIFPNPANNELNVRFENEISRQGEFQFFDSQGNQVKSIEVVGGSAQLLNVDVSDFAAGIYCLVYRTEEKVFVEKIMILND